MSDYLPQPLGWPANLNILKCTILNGSAGTSEVIPMQGRAIVGLIMPTTWVAAAIQYYACINGNPRELRVIKDGTTGVLLQTLVAASDWIVFPMADAYFGPYIQLKSVTAASVNAVDQTADREILLLTRNLFD